MFVYQAGIDHCHHFEHVGIGDAAAFHHLRFNAQCRGHLGGSSATAVHQDFGTTDGRKVVEQARQRDLVFYHGTAYLHNCQLLFHHYIIV